MSRRYFEMLPEEGGSQWSIGSYRTLDGSSFDGRSLRIAKSLPFTKLLATTQIADRCEVLGLQGGVPLVRRDLLRELDTECGLGYQKIDVAIDGNESDYSLLNILSVSNCLDVQKSSLSRFPVDFPNRNVVGRVMSLYRPVLNVPLDVKSCLFRLGEYLPYFVVDDRFVAAAQGCGSKLQFLEIEVVERGV